MIESMTPSMYIKQDFSAEIAAWVEQGIQNTLQQRGERYGDFSSVAETTYQLQEVLKRSQASVMTSSQIIALDMICNKMARIVNGDPNYIDNWHDIAGYATLVEQELIMTGHDKEAV